MDSTAQLIFAMKMQRVISEVGTERLNIIQINFRLQRVKYFPPKILNLFFNSAMLATCPYHLNLLNLIILTILGIEFIL
jgi:hypothetical protein